MKPKYLTNSRFKLAMECPTKLYYTGKEAYVNQKIDDPFLDNLIKGGFQIGELAKAYYPGGHMVESLDYETALKETNELLKRENCIIYEAAIKYENFFIRVDILVKEKDKIKVIEAKSKSINLSNENNDENPAESLLLYKGGKNKGKIRNEWQPYIYDIAFQQYVLENALPDYEITPYLLLVDQNAKCPTDDLYKKFTISIDRKNGGYSVLTKQLTNEDLSVQMLVPIKLNELCRKVIDEYTYEFQEEMIHFAQLITIFADHYQADRRIVSAINSKCKHCEFKASEEQLHEGLKSGYHECFSKVLQWNEKDFADDTIFDLWDFRRTDKLLEQGTIKLKNVTKDDIGFQQSKKLALSRTERQWLQIQKAKESDTTYYLEKKGLQSEKDKWKFPLHFIDFETAKPVIPFNKGRKPNEMIAFQFSHHIVYENGTIEHKNQFLHTEPGVNPNYEFVRALKKALGNDQGTIFRYATHENKVLNNIFDELTTDASYIEDREELREFIRSITQYRNEDGKLIKDSRNMVDLLELVKKYYYDPYMKGSNSIKVVLPAILNSSEYLQEKYAKPIYGAENGIKSLNFENETWIVFDNGEVVDPYKRLPNVFADISDEELEKIDLHAELNNGTAAMAAYERLQLEDLPHELRKKIEEGMLKYCELDTLAMVMIYEGWVDMINKA